LIASLEVQLSQIPTMKTEQLRALWRDLFGQPPHLKLRREILIPILSYRLQEKTLGGLKPATAKRLRSLAEEIAGGTGRITSITPRVKTGARFVREYQGRLTSQSLLTGLLFDEAANRYIPTHAQKSGKRYRYYTSQAVIRKAEQGNSIGRIPALELERGTRPSTERFGRRSVSSI
jgi:hypothetical protein